MKKTFLVFTLLLMAGLVFAQTPFTATYTFGNNGNVTSFAYNGTSYPGITMGNIDKVGVTSTSSNGNFRADHWPSGATNGSDTFTGSVDTGKYFGFTINAEPGYTFTVNSITFGIGRSGTGTRTTQWRGSADSYAAVIDNYTSLNAGLTNTNGVLENPDSNGNWTGNVLSLGASYQNISTSCGFRIYLYNSEATTGTAGLQGPITISGTYESTSAQPLITVNPTTLSGFSYVAGSGPSTNQTFTVSGSNLTSNISVSAPTNYEISLTSGSGYTSPLTLNQSGGTVTTTTIYARLKGGLSVGNYNNEAITASSSGADSKTVTCNGSVTSPPPPVAPLATAATNVGNNSFTANWDSVSGATGYYLDVYTKQGDGTTDLFISEYIEGSSNNKAIEIYNGTGSTVDLSQYLLHKQTNGAGSFGGNFALTGTLANNAVHIVAHASANATIRGLAQQTTGGSPMDFNGNDAVALFKGSTMIDVVGVVDQVADWGKDVTLVRQADATAPSTTYIASEWDSHATDTITYLGSHTFSGALSITYVSGYENLNVKNVTSHNVTGLTPGTTYYYVVRAYNSYGTSDDSNEIEVTTTSTSPLITLSASALTDFTYMEGSGPSEEQSFTVSGSNLTANISLAAPTNYQISTGTGASFDANMANPLVINQSGGSIAETTIYVRLQAGLTAGDYDDEVITASSTGADNKTVTCSGTVEPIPNPEISVTPTKLDGFFYIIGNGPSAVKTFKVSGSYLEEDIEINAPTNYEISEASGGPFGSYIALAPNNGVVAETTIYVRLIEGLPIAAYMGEQISISSDGADDEYVTLNGFVQTDQDPFCYWDFNVNPPVDGANWAQSIASNIGDGSLNYTFTKAVSFNGTQLNGMTEETLAGKSFAPQGGPNEVENNGENFIMAVDTSQLKDITMTYATQRTGTGFTSQAIWYSLDGGENFIHFTTFTSIADSWEVKTVDFTNVNGANNNPNFQVKIVLDGATSEAGNNRFDNIGFFGREDVNPVELASFTATISAQNYITLTWVTQTETGMRGYYVFRAPANDLASAQIVSPMIESVNSSQQQTYIYEDRELYDSGIYYYWLQANDLDGSSAFHGPVSVVFSAAGDNPTPEIPLVTQLHSAYPNPFNPTVFIPFSLAEDGAVSFKIYNSRGQMVKHFDLGAKTAGHHRIIWDGTDYNGKALANGVYQIMMSTKNQTYQSKATLLK